ncbi:GAF domain-containing protein [Variovorax sp. JS1663]|uniref:GAF domain-containing protein n=1 Tax=Variovorax sp. JS1663 TaxID=1851577 RepID=UPI000B346221|nr:GAF domain-containing protein [Variovorax sp. JS1663]
METPPPQAQPSGDDAWTDRLDVITSSARHGAGEVSVRRSIGELLGVVRELLKLEVVFVSELVDGQRVFRFVESGGLPTRVQPGLSAPLEQTICQRILDGRLPNLVLDVEAVRRTQGLPDSFEGMGTHIGVPVRHADGRLYGMLCGFNRTGTADLGEKDVRRLEVAANAAAQLLARAEGGEGGVWDPALL